MHVSDVIDVDDGVHYTMDRVIRSNRAEKTVPVTQ